jgi:hypothetical protein
VSQPTLLGLQQFLACKSFVELNACERAQALLDEGSYRELLGPEGGPHPTFCCDRHGAGRNCGKRIRRLQRSRYLVHRSG